MTCKKRHIGDLRELLFNQLDALCSTTKDVDLERARVVNDTAKQVIESAKVEVEYARVIQGAMTMPFIERQEDGSERPHPSLPPARTAPAAAPALTSGEPMQDALSSGPPENHPWKGLGTRVHRLEH